MLVVSTLQTGFLRKLLSSLAQLFVTAMQLMLLLVGLLISIKIRLIITQCRLAVCLDSCYCRIIKWHNRCLPGALHQ